MPDIFETVVVCVINGYAEVSGRRTKVFLIGKRRSDIEGPGAGQWHIPGGRLLFGETEKIAAMRMAREKTDLSTIAKSCIATSTSQRLLPDGMTKHDQQKWFDLEVLPNSEQAKAGSDLAEIRWVTGNTVRRFVTDDVVDTWPAEIYSFLGIWPE